MKNIFLAVLIISFSGCETSRVFTAKSRNYNQSAPRTIAIFPISGDISKTISDAMTTEFMAMGYEVAERTALNDLLKEMKLDFSGVLDANERKEVAKAIGADALIFGSAKTTLGGDIYFLDLRLVDVQTGEILWSSNYLKKAPDDPRYSITAISKSIQKAIDMPVLQEGKAFDAFARSRIGLAQNATLPRKKYKKAALLPLNGSNFYGEKDAIYGALMTSLLGNGVAMVERKQLDDLFEEQLRGGAGLYGQLQENKSASSRGSDSGVYSSTAAFFSEVSLSKKQLSEIGRITGADVLLIGSFNSDLNISPFNISFANLRVLDLETGRLAWSSTYFNTSTGTEDYVVSADWLAIAIGPAIMSKGPSDYIRNYEAAVKNKKSSESLNVKMLVRAKIVSKNDAALDGKKYPSVDSSDQDMWK